MEWLDNMGDWMISKKRFWGLALPIYKCVCGHVDVLGSEKELKERAVEGWDDFEGHSPHRPWVDAVKIRCTQCGVVVSRINDVGNPWLDAGIVPYSTLGYRHGRDQWNHDLENQEVLDHAQRMSGDDTSSALSIESISSSSIVSYFSCIRMTMARPSAVVEMLTTIAVRMRTVGRGFV